MNKLATLLDAGNFADLILEARKAARDRRAFADSALKTWAGRRFRNLFLNHAIHDPVALEAASGHAFLGIFGADQRPERQRIAERFLKGDGPTEWNLDMPAAAIPELKNTTILFCPGMLNGMLPVRAFQEALPAAERKYGWKILRADLHPMRGCEANISDLLAAMNEGQGLRADTTLIGPGEGSAPGDVMIIAYSKGTPDVLTALVQRPELRKRVRCIFNWAGAPGGSYLANDIYDSLKDLPVEVYEKRLDMLLKMVSPVVNTDFESLRRVAELDLKTCIHDLSTEVRGKFMKEYSETINDMGIPIFNITGSTTALEVPYFQMQGVNQLNRYDANNDMQVTQDQGKVKLPMATDLAMMRGHHWDLSYSPFPVAMRFGSPHLDHPFPKEAALTAMVQLAAELGLID
ncbi:MAG: hypothetical protein K1X75_07525 [Leptospirales bacterium]|nr:hypothetical protein [Leptospirales bacterium]